MSPSEFDLRNALHDGEDPDAAVDVSAVIRHATQLRRDRRVRWASAGAAAAVVLGLSGALVVIHHHSSPGHGVAAAAAGGASSANAEAQKAPPALAPQASPSRASGSVQAGLTNNGADSATSGAASCAATAPKLADPTSSTAPMFAADVVSMTACGYNNAGSLLYGSDGNPLVVVLSERDVTATLVSITSASTTPVPIPCVRRPGATGLLVLHANYANGTADPVEASTSLCDDTISNGATERYDWQPPSTLTGFENTIDGAAGIPRTPSPIRS